MQLNTHLRRARSTNTCFDLNKSSMSAEMPVQIISYLFYATALLKTIVCIWAIQETLISILEMINISFWRRKARSLWILLDMNQDMLSQREQLRVERWWNKRRQNVNNKDGFVHFSLCSVSQITWQNSPLIINLHQAQKWTGISCI